MVDEVMSNIQVGLSRFPLLQTLVRGSQLKGWEKLLKAQDDAWSFLSSLNYNMLLTLTIAGGDSEHPFFPTAINILTKLEAYMSAFTKLAEQKKFKDKINNLKGVNFLSTLSELSIAYQLHQASYQIEFETPFSRPDLDSIKDVDITAWLPGRRPFHIEVYMPHEQLQSMEEADVEYIAAVHFNYSAAFLDFNSSNVVVSTRVDSKNRGKFGTLGFTGLEGMCLLAVNEAYVDTAYIQSRLGISDYSKLQQIVNCSKGIQGLIVFEDNFGSKHPFQLRRILFKQEPST